MRLQKAKTTKRIRRRKTRRGEWNEGRRNYILLLRWMVIFGFGTGIILNLNQTTIFPCDAEPFVVVLASSLSSILFFLFDFVLTKNNNFFLSFVFFLEMKCQCTKATRENEIFWWRKGGSFVLRRYQFSKVFSNEIFRRVSNGNRIMDGYKVATNKERRLYKVFLNIKYKEGSMKESKRILPKKDLHNFGRYFHC